MEMRDAHLTADEIGHFLDKGDQLINRLFLHHLAVCPGCYAVAGHVLDLYQAGETAGSRGRLTPGACSLR